MKITEEMLDQLVTSLYFVTFKHDFINFVANKLLKKQYAKGEAYATAYILWSNYEKNHFNLIQTYGDYRGDEDLKPILIALANSEQGEIDDIDFFKSKGE